MDEISAAELMELAFSSESSIDTQFQVWMAAICACGCQLCGRKESFTCYPTNCKPGESSSPIALWRDV